MQIMSAMNNNIIILKASKSLISCYPCDRNFGIEAHIFYDIFLQKNLLFITSKYPEWQWKEAKKYKIILYKKTT